MGIQDHARALGEVEDGVVDARDVDDHGARLRQRPHALEHVVARPAGELLQLVVDEGPRVVRFRPAAFDPPVVVEDVGGGRACGHGIPGFAAASDENGGARAGLDEGGDGEIRGIIVLREVLGRLEKIADLTHLIVELLPLIWSEAQVVVARSHVVADI